MSGLTNASGRLSRLQNHLSGKTETVSICRRDTTAISADARSVLDTRNTINVLDSFISYLDTGAGDNVVLFLHGNPTQAFLWRNIIPHVKGVARCVAPDLIGMGYSGKPDIKYRYVEHYKYLSAWIEQMKFPGRITIVCHDWGSGLGFHWCNQNRSRVRAMVYMEGLVKVAPNWDMWPDAARGIFQALRSDAGEEMVLKKNFFVERLFPGSIMRTLDDSEMDVYRAPYRETEKSRLPTLTWPREIPVRSDGPADVVLITDNYSKWLSTSKEFPKLYIHGDPGFFSAGMQQVVKDWPNQKTVTVKGLHFLQEDSPDEIGQAIKEFLQDVYKS